MTETDHNIKIVRLQSGQDIITELEEYYEEQVLRLINPMTLYFKRSQAGTVLMIAPWLPVELVEENISIISTKDVLAIFDPKVKVIDYYKDMVNVQLAEWLKNHEDMFGEEEDSVENYSMSDYEEDDLEVEELTSNRTLH